MARDPSELARNAEGASVTVDRLEGPVIDALGADEQPQQLLAGDSLDYRPADRNESERLFSRVDTAVSLVATARRILLVVPRAVTDETYSIEYDDLSECTVETGQFPVVRLDTGTRLFSINLSARESPEPVVGYIRRRQTATETASSAPESADTTSEDRSTETARSTESAEADTDGSAGASDPLDKIERLAELRDQGVLTEAEFESKKQQFLDEL